MWRGIGSCGTIRNTTLSLVVGRKNQSSTTTCCLPRRVDSRRGETAGVTTVTILDRRRHSKVSSPSSVAKILALCCVWYHRPQSSSSITVVGALLIGSRRTDGTVWVRGGGISSSGSVDRYNNCHPLIGLHHNNNNQKPTNQRRIHILTHHHRLNQRFFTSHLSSSSTSSVGPLNDEDEVIPARCTVPSGHDKKSQSTKHLPRLYIGGNTNGKNDTNTGGRGNTSIPFVRGAIVPLTNDQEKYLHVMRITQSKRWGAHTGHVRIFNGVDGEWLAKLTILDGGGSSSSTPTTTTGKKRRRNSGGGNIRNDDSSSGTVLECVEPLLPQPVPSHHQTTTTSLHLYMGRIQKRDRRRWVLEKVTELGVDGIVIINTEFSSSSSTTGDPWEFEKHYAHVVEAAEQCERLTIPTLTEHPLSWDELVNEIQQQQQHELRQGDTNNNRNVYWLVCRERSETSPPILKALQTIYDYHRNRRSLCQESETNTRIGKSSSTPDRDSVTDVGHANNDSMVIHILVGPEGGWSTTELDTFSSLMMTTNMQPMTDTTHQSQKEPVPVVQFVSLGSTILRAETAAITAIATTRMSFQEI